MIKKVVIALLIITVGIAGAFAGGKQEGTVAKRTLQLIVWGSGAMDTYRKIEAVWASQFPDSSLQIEMQDVGQYIAARLAQNQLPDMWYTSGYVSLTNYAKQGILMDLSGEPFVNALLATVPKDAFTYDGKVYGYPSMAGTMGLFYNSDLFDKAGIREHPRTISALKTATSKMKGLGVIPWATCYKDYWPMDQAFLTLMGNAIGAANFSQWVRDMNNGKQTFNLPRYAGVVQVWDLMKQNGTPNAMDADYNKQMVMMAEGQAAMYSSNDSTIGDILKSNPNIKMGAAPMPVSEDPADALMGVDVSITIVASKASKNADLIKRFFNWCIDTKLEENWTTWIAKDYALLPWFKYDGPLGTQAGALPMIKDYMARGETIPWLLWRRPDGMFQEERAVFEAYYLGQINGRQMASQLDEIWHRLAAQQK
jgi:raffinose/stachyose/melibiose transport system substrate-binding protein